MVPVTPIACASSVMTPFVSADGLSSISAGSSADPDDDVGVVLDGVVSEHVGHRPVGEQAPLAGCWRPTATSRRTAPAVHWSSRSDRSARSTASSASSSCRRTTTAPCRSGCRSSAARAAGPESRARPPRRRHTAFRCRRDSSTAIVPSVLLSISTPMPRDDSSTVATRAMTSADPRSPPRRRSSWTWCGVMCDLIDPDSCCAGRPRSAPCSPASDAARSD